MERKCSARTLSFSALAQFVNAGSFYSSACCTERLAQLADREDLPGSDRGWYLYRKTWWRGDGSEERWKTHARWGIPARVTCHKDYVPRLVTINLF